MNRTLTRATATAALALLISGAVAATAAAAPGTELHVTTKGGDSDCTTAAKACSIDVALNRAETLVAKGEKPSVVLHDGTYRLKKSIVLDAKTAGVTIRSAEGAEVILDGGMRLTGWTAAPEVGDNVYKTRLPDHTATFRQLYDGGERAVLARYPNRADEVNGGPHLRLPVQPEETSRTTCEASGALVNCELTIPAIPTDAVSGEWWHGAQLVKADHWHYKELNIAAITPAGGDDTRVAFVDEQQEGGKPDWTYAQGSSTYLWAHTPPDGSPYYVQDSLALLDDTQEWFYDKDTHVVYYKTADGKAPADNRVVIPQVEKLLTVSNTHDVTVSGLTFQYSNWAAPDTAGYASPQSGQPQWTNRGEKPVPGAVTITSGKDITLSGNTVRRTGDNGILVHGTSARIEISGNRISDTSSSGVSLYAGIAYKDERNTVTDARVTGNVIRDVGKHYADAPGILGTQVCDTRIEHNDISYSKYAGVSVGSFTSNKSVPESSDEYRNRCERMSDVASDSFNTVSHNRISNAMLMLDDGAPIYVLGRNPGMMIEQNFISGVRRTAYAGNNPVPGIYIDESGADMTVRENVLDIGTTTAFFVSPSNTHRNELIGNWYTGPLGAIENLPGVTKNENTAVPDGKWTKAALDVIANSGPTGNGALPRPLTVTSPTPSYTEYEDKPLFAGGARPGSLIEVRGATYNTLIASTTAGEDGRWQVRSTVDLPASATPHRMRVKEWAKGTTTGEAPTEHRLVEFTRADEVRVTSPVDGDRYFTPITTVEGIAAPGSFVEVRGAQRNDVRGTAVADESGAWSASVEDVTAAPFGASSYTFMVHEYVGTARVSTNRVTFERAKILPLTVTLPAEGESVKARALAFYGNGEPGATITIHDAVSGEVLGKPVVVKEIGKWWKDDVVLDPRAEKYGVRVTQSMRHAEDLQADIAFFITD